MNMKRMVAGLTIMVAVIAGIQGAAFAAETGELNLTKDHDP